MKRSGLWTPLLAVIFVLTSQFGRAEMVAAWVRQYNNAVTNSMDSATKVVVDKAGDVIVAGYADRGASGHDMLTIKYSGKNGSLIWKRLYDGPAHGKDEARALATDDQNNVIITGPSPTTVHNIDFYTAKYSASDGALLWQRRYDGPAHTIDSPQAVATDRSGNVIVSGFSAVASAQTQFYTVKYAAQDGAILWERRYGSPMQNFDEARGVAVDNNDDVLVTGVSHGQGTQTDYYTVKYAGADGAIIWEKRYDGSGNLYDNATALTVDWAGNAIVTGASYASAGISGFHAVKYASVDGALIWEQRGPGGFPVAVSTDPSGNVVVAGYGTDYSTTTEADYYTARYAAADGALLWEKRYDAGVNGRDYARALVVDRNGNVLVTGISFNGTAYNYATTKYAATNGALLWERRSGATTGRGDHARSVTVDEKGDAIVTGHSYTAGTADVRTEKYDAATGALLWRADYDDASNGFEAPVSLAVVVDGGGRMLQWPPGYTLQTATNIHGPFTDITASGSYTINPGSDLRRYFRLRRQAPPGH